MLLGLGGHHLGWDERRGYSKLGRHESNGRRLRPRDGLHLLKGTRLADVLSGAWLPWSQFIPADITTPAESAAVTARKASIIIDGRHPGCSERFNRYAPTCYFDSKMSLARFKGKFLVFARANTVERGGGRFVQVAESAGDDPGGPYGRFEMITIEGYTDIRSGNIYTAVVREHPLEPRMLLGLFSVNEGQPGRVNKDGKCYIALSLSCDGRRWSRLVPLIPTAGEKGRTFDQPVGGLVRRGASVHFYVQRDVPQISAAAPTESRLERYTFRGSALRQLTAAAKARICPWASFFAKHSTSNGNAGRRPRRHVGLILQPHRATSSAAAAISARRILFFVGAPDRGDHRRVRSHHLFSPLASASLCRRAEGARRPRRCLSPPTRRRSPSFTLRKRATRAGLPSGSSPTPGGMASLQSLPTSPSLTLIDLSSTHAPSSLWQRIRAAALCPGPSPSLTSSRRCHAISASRRPSSPARALPSLDAATASTRQRTSMPSHGGSTAQCGFSARSGFYRVARATTLTMPSPSSLIRGSATSSPFMTRPFAAVCSSRLAAAQRTTSPARQMGTATSKGARRRRRAASIGSASRARPTRQRQQRRRKRARGGRGWRVLWR